MSSLTDEQRKMIEEKKKAAQAKLAAKFGLKTPPSKPQPAKMNNNNNYQCRLSNTGSISLPPSSNTKANQNNYNKSQKMQSNTIICGTCELISKDRFTVHVAYHQQLISIFKTIQNKIYGKNISTKYNVNNVSLYKNIYLVVLFCFFF